METESKKQANLTNNDFRELLKNHTPIKREQPEEITSEVKKEKRGKKTKKKKYEKRDDSLEQLLSRYRDRARERREGKNPDYLCSSNDLVDPIGYHAVGPDAKYNNMMAERRKQLIQESKYLGGDMQHTHLVKGLDFALLNKVRSEIEEKTKEVPVETVEVEDTGLKCQMAKNINDILFKSTTAIKNPLFAPGKMCYLVDLVGKDQLDSDIPTTVIRSHVSTIGDGIKTMTITDAFIEKIRKVINRANGDCKYKKLKKAEPLFEFPQLIKEDKKPEFQNNERAQISKTQMRLKKLLAEPTGYEECYPGAEAMMEAANDSDCEDLQPVEEDASRFAKQFGLKIAAGRKTRRSERGQKDSLDREWERIKDRLQL